MFASLHARTYFRTEKNFKIHFTLKKRLKKLSQKQATFYPRAGDDDDAQE
jgi:hypothetical protein